MVPSSSLHYWPHLPFWNQPSGNLSEISTWLSPPCAETKYSSSKSFDPKLTKQEDSHAFAKFAQHVFPWGPLQMLRDWESRGSARCFVQEVSLVPPGGSRTLVVRWWRSPEALSPTFHLLVTPSHRLSVRQSHAYLSGWWWGGISKHCGWCLLLRDNYAG